MQTHPVPAALPSRPRYLYGNPRPSPPFPPLVHCHNTSLHTASSQCTNALPSPAGHKNSQLPICVSFSPCLRHLGCGSEDKVAYLYDIRQVGPLVWYQRLIPVAAVGQRIAELLAATPSSHPLTLPLCGPTPPHRTSPGCWRTVCAAPPTSDSPPLAPLPGAP